MANALTIAAVAILVPLFMSKVFLPWLKNKGKGSYETALAMISFAFGLYGYWLYKVISEIQNYNTIVLLSLPVIITFILELVFLLNKKHQLLHKLNKYFTVVSFPMCFVIALLVIASTTTRYFGPNDMLAIITLLLCAFFMQGFLYFPSFALYRKINPDTPIAHEIKLGFLDKYLTKKDFDKSTEYRNLKNFGIEIVTAKKFFISLLKYGLAISFFYGYMYLILTVFV